MWISTLSSSEMCAGLSKARDLAPFRIYNKAGLARPVFPELRIPSGKTKHKNSKTRRNMGRCVERDGDQGQQGVSIKAIMGHKLSCIRGRRRKNMSAAAERQGSQKGRKGDKAYERKQR